MTSLKKTAGRQAFASLLVAISENKVLSVGPHGEAATAPMEFGLTREEFQSVRQLGATAAIVMHYGGNDWSRAQIAGLRAQFTEMGVDVVAVTDAGFDPEKQVADLEGVLALHPDVIVSIPTDPNFTAEAYRAAASSGVKLVFMDNVPKGAKAGVDYVSVVSTDNVGNGVVCADLMAEALGGRGTVGMIVHDADFFVTRQRREGFESTIRQDYPRITIVDEIGVAGPDFAAKAQEAASTMLARNPDLKGIWAVWDVLALGVLAAVRMAGRNDLVVTTVDLGLSAALELARGGMVLGIGAQRPFDQGVAEAELAAYGLLGKDAPPYVVLPALPVSRTSVLEAWESVYHRLPPPELVEAAM